LKAERTAQESNPKARTKNLILIKGKNMNTPTTNRNRNTDRNRSNSTAATKGTKRGVNRRFQSPKYFVIAAETNKKVGISDKSFEILSSWIELKSREKAVESEMNAMKPAVIDVVKDLGGDVKFLNFEFLNKTRNTFSYSAEVNDLERQLEALKKQERESGAAQLVKSTPYVECSAIKEKK
jgi:hypothetical protein